MLGTIFSLLFLCVCASVLFVWVERLKNFGMPMLCFSFASFIQSLRLFSLLSSSLFCFFSLLYRLLYTKVGCDDGRIRKQERPVYCVFSFLPFTLSSLGRPFFVLSPPCWLKFFRIAQSPRIAGSPKGKWLSFRDWFLAMDGRMFVNDAHIIQVHTRCTRECTYLEKKSKTLSKIWKTKSESDCADTIRSRSWVWSSNFRPVQWLIVFVYVQERRAPERKTWNGGWEV